MDDYTKLDSKVFPVRAGVFLGLLCCILRQHRIPRESGGVSMGITRQTLNVWYSP